VASGLMPADADDVDDVDDDDDDADDVDQTPLLIWGVTHYCW